MEVYKAKRHVQVLIHELQEKEEQIDQPVFLTRGDHIGMISRMLLLDLKHAIRNKELYMLYQPQVYSDGTCIGAEALLRWNHPVYGMIYPPLIIYLAEAGKVLPELERFIIDEVTNGIVQTRAQYDSDFKISVNITAHSLLWDIEGYIRQTMEQKGIDAHMLWIEITEQDILLQTDVVVRKLEELKKQGHKLLIDDFGMGHTSLLYLQSEYFDVVKLDGSLTRPLLKSHTNQKIVRSIIELGQELGVKVIAEFVENREQRDLLDTLGCHCYQGYLYAKPLELEAFITYMKQMNEK
jgi:EAL domain-containing protein (putative c-di-GMP-specific phosphodiesterase class I)